MEGLVVIAKVPLYNQQHLGCIQIEVLMKHRREAQINLVCGVAAQASHL